ncbi:hypothetical protein FLL45_08140 [Aliikangiella marina]|uniref:Uncharacterized protein n=2 Tax=Aliikangiella marina TaxID=1712262 RepID=A0A545TEN2_9GAMM|nr:hypothetical protein FLL45_08140 [Aliikangiella marina]
MLVLMSMTGASFAHAAGRSSWAVPTQVDIERGNGFMVYGMFGNPGECTSSNKFYVKKEHPQYDKIYSAILAAFTSGKKIRTYIHDCETVLWYSNASVTYNILMPNGDVQIKN